MTEPIELSGGNEFATIITMTMLTIIKIPGTFLESTLEMRKKGGL